MENRTTMKSRAYWGRKAKGCLFQKFNCSEATMQTCQDMLDRREDVVLTSVAGIEGGIVCRGSSCGVVSGGTLGIGLMHDEALQKNGPETEAAIVSLASNYVKWFGDNYGTTLCRERSGVDFWTLGGLIMYLLPGHRMVRCISHINGAMKHLYDIQQSSLPTIDLVDESPMKHLHCAQAVLEGVRANTGIGDPVLERISIVLDGGVGLQGGACGALACAILAINILLGVNLREVSLPRSYYIFFKGLTYLRSDRPDEIPDPFNVGKRIVTKFEEASGSIDCSTITGKEFMDWDNFQSYVRSSDKCKELIDLSISEATWAIERYSKAQ
jgi:hypothetical protein